ncbi:hypothetical protein NE237_027090 [Protea cynaroides]|uniref:Uncharacterized protein n=1 Tax=Protea cynaroides TaxID=273540 RepID=A0A9Q0GPH1_9MAGN|nr:hypothetical protein NE237_027090 [Protea cynaroides]
MTNLTFVMGFWDFRLDSINCSKKLKEEKEDVGDLTFTSGGCREVGVLWDKFKSNNLLDRAITVVDYDFTGSMICAWGKQSIDVTNLTFLIEADVLEMTEEDGWSGFLKPHSIRNEIGMGIADAILDEMSNKIVTNMFFWVNNYRPGSHSTSWILHLIQIKIIRKPSLVVPV